MFIKVLTQISRSRSSLIILSCTILGAAYRMIFVLNDELSLMPLRGYLLYAYYGAMTGLLFILLKTIWSKISIPIYTIDNQKLEMIRKLPSTDFEYKKFESEKSKTEVEQCIVCNMVISEEIKNPSGSYGYFCKSKNFWVCQPCYECH